MSDPDASATISIGNDVGSSHSTQARTRTNPPDSTWSEQGNVRNRFLFTGNPGLKVNVEDKDNPFFFYDLMRVSST